MNYYLSYAELQLLATLLGATQMFGFDDAVRMIPREEIVQLVHQMVQEEILSPAEGGFTCNPEIRKLMEPMLQPSYCISITDLRRQRPQICCYAFPGSVTLLESAQTRKSTFRIGSADMSQLRKALGEGGYLPEKEPEGNKLPKGIDKELWSFDAQLTFEQPELRATLLMEAYDGKTTKKLAGLAVIEDEDCAALCHILENGNKLQAYQSDEVDRWLQQYIGGKTHDFG